MQNGKHHCDKNTNSVRLILLFTPKWQKKQRLPLKNSSVHGYSSCIMPDE